MPFDWKSRETGAFCLLIFQKAYRWNVRRKWRKEVAEIEGGGLDAGGAGSGGGGGDTLENIDLDEAYLDQLQQQVSAAHIWLISNSI